jgi:hypothetical protein
MVKNTLLNRLRHGAPLAFIALVASVGARADVIDHSKGFDPHDDLTANRCALCDPGTASFPVLPDGTTVARITRAVNDQRGSIFSNDPVCITSFAMQFTFRIGPFDPIADGMAFVIQSNGADALGSGGGGLGYGRDIDPELEPRVGEVIPNSVAIKIDFWNNHSETDNSTGLFTNGRTPTIPKKGWLSCDASGCNPLVLPDTLVPLDKRLVVEGGSGIDFHSNHVFSMDLIYDGITLTEIITDTVTQATVTVSYLVDIPSVVAGKTANVGFTGATGGVNAEQDVLSWRYECPAPTK